MCDNVFFSGSSFFFQRNERIHFLAHSFLVVSSAYFTQIPFKISPDPLRRREEVWKMLYWIIFLGDPINCLVPTYSLNIAGIIVVMTAKFIGICL